MSLIRRNACLSIWTAITVVICTLQMAGMAAAANTASAGDSDLFDRLDSACCDGRIRIRTNRCRARSF
jgi:hypothetical protein